MARAQGLITDSLKLSAVHVLQFSTFLMVLRSQHREAIHQPMRTPASQTVVSVLSMFEQHERAAMLRNDYSTVQHYRECWLTVHESVFGDTRVSGVRPSPQASPVMPVVVTERPKWWTAKYSRPLRRVIEHREQRSRCRQRSGPAVVRLDVLECGHKLPDQSQITGSAPAKHRRCRECVA